MAVKPINVLHLETETGWRGGQQQILYLHKGLIENDIGSVVVCPEGSKLAQACVKENLPVYLLKSRRHYNFVSAVRTAGIIRKGNYNFLHAHSSHALTLGLIVKLFIPNIILTASRRVDFSVRKPIFGPIKYSNSFVNKIICISDAIKNVLISDGIPAKKLVTVHSGVDTSSCQVSAKLKLQLKKELGIPENDIAAGTIAALAGHKDYPTLMRAAKRVIQTDKNITFIAAGSGPDEQELVKLHSRLNLGKKFIFAGFREDTADLLKMFDIFVLSSRMEGMGTSILDAQSAALPIVAARAGGIPEIVQDGRNGILTDTGDDKALAEAVIKLARDKQLRKNLGKIGQSFVKRFDYRQTVLKTINVYRSLFDDCENVIEDWKKSTHAVS